MNSNIYVALIAGGFALIGATLGALLAARFARAAEHRRIDAEDQRRWLVDRRATYYRFLELAELLHREIDRVAVFLSYDGKTAVSNEDEEALEEGLLKYHIRWEEELQRLLGEVMFLASPSVADLADRTSGALLEITSEIETRGAFADYYPAWFQAGDLIEVLRDGMRQELGIEPLPPQPSDRRRQDDWPWLKNRPGRETYLQ